MIKNIVIITGGDKPVFSSIAKIIDEADMIICADSGGDYAYENHIMPTHLLGDFDSISSVAKEFFAEKDVEILTVPAEKDFTDSEMAINLAVQWQPEKLYICGGCGSRFDHSIANIFLFSKYLEKIPMLILLEKGYLGYYSTGYLEIEGEIGQTISLIPLKNSILNISIHGFYYPLEHGKLEWGSSMGVSNVLIADHAVITHDSGILFVIQHTEKVF